jgi:hypothetical protein
VLEHLVEMLHSRDEPARLDRAASERSVSFHDEGRVAKASRELHQPLAGFVSGTNLGAEHLRQTDQP